VTDGIKGALRGALIRILRPLVHWLLHVGFSASEFVDLVKELYIDAARERLAEDAGPQGGRKRQKSDTQVAISTITGVSRQFVRDYLNGDRRVSDTTKGGQRPSRVLAAWWHENQWHTPGGRPAKLPITGRGRTFEMLCREASGEHRAHNAILAELMRVGAVQVHNGMVELIRPTYTTFSWSAASVTEMGETIGSHIETWCYNFLNPDTPLMCKGIVNPNIKRQAEGVLRNQLRTQMESTISIAGRLLHSEMHTVPPDMLGQPASTLGIHCFMFRREGSSTPRGPSPMPVAIDRMKKKTKRRAKG
jgi:hypothetical protein